MTYASKWGVSPRQSVQRECARRGRQEVIAGCIDLLSGQEADAELIVALGGPPARWALTGEPAGPGYWLRVWAARGLLWVWDDDALSAIVTALSDEAWRVREMALKVVARHDLDETIAVVADLQQDPVPRVRSAAARAMAKLHRA